MRAQRSPEDRDKWVGRVRPVSPPPGTAGVVPAGTVDTSTEAPNTRRADSRSSHAPFPQAADLPEAEPGDVMPTGASNAAS